MKTGIHPKYHQGIIIECACGGKFIAGSTKEVIKTEICSACHPFYTGKKKLVDTAGRVEKYLEKVKKAQKSRELAAKKIDEEMDEIVEEQKEAQTDKVAEIKEKAPEKKAAPKKTTKKTA